MLGKMFLSLVRPLAMYSFWVRIHKLVRTCFHLSTRVMGAMWVLSELVRGRERRHPLGPAVGCQQALQLILRFQHQLLGHWALWYVPLLARIMPSASQSVWIRPREAKKHSAYEC